MAEFSSSSKRRKVGDARRLHGYADELLSISGAIAQCAFTRKSPRSAGSALPLRPAPRVTPDRSAIPQPPARTGGARAQQRQSPKTLAPPQTLFSVVPASSLAAKSSSSAVGRDAWKQTLLQTAKELAPTDIHVEDRVGRLLRRYDALAASVDMYQDQVKRLSNEILLNERVESQLEREEKEWEEKMQVREQRVAELEVELKALRETAAAGSDARDEGNDASDDDDRGSEAEEEDAADEHAELREALALRMEEKRDIRAAIESLERKKQQRSFAADRAPLPSSGSSSDGSDAAAPSEREQALLRELQELQVAKDALQRQIIASEEEQEAQDEHSAELPSLKSAVADAKQRRGRAQSRLESAKLSLSRLKARMKHMVDVQMLTARDTSPSPLREEAVILHLLYEHEGEMGVNELKLATGTIMAAHGKPSSNGVVIRALYSLVANGVVQIDRSFGNGLVTSLLV